MTRHATLEVQRHGRPISDMRPLNVELRKGHRIFEIRGGVVMNTFLGVLASIVRPFWPLLRSRVRLGSLPGDQMRRVAIALEENFRFGRVKGAGFL